MSRSTADNILAALQHYHLTDEGNGKYRCDSPLRPGSNSLAFCLKIDGPEHGTWFDQVNGEKGSLYELATLLSIPLPSQTKTAAPPSSKRVYSGLADYAQEHGVTAGVYAAAGWTETTHKGRNALRFPTDTGPRWRYLDTAKPPYDCASGYKPCWYRLAEAIVVAQASGQPLVLCNGEPSTVAAQLGYGVAATCITNSGERELPAPLLAQLQAVWTGPIFVALDCDKKGRDHAPKLAAQLASVGYTVSIVDLGGSNGFDLADFCRLHTTDSIADLGKRAQVFQAAPPVSGPVSQTALTDANLSDSGNAESLVAVAGDLLRYCHTRKKWLHWDGARWAIDLDGAAHRQALVVVRMRYHAAANIPDFARRKRLADWSITSESAGRLNAMLAVAATAHPFTSTIAAYDTDSMLAGTESGTLDLRTGVCRPANRDDNITMLLGTPYDPTATCPRWRQFLQEIFSNDTELIAFIQRAIGYCLTGDIREEVIFLLVGEGGNGKSKFLEVLRALLGDYADVASFETFNAERKSEQTNDLAALAAKRLVVAIETDEDRRLAEARVKMVTGGDKISCRFLYGEFFSYLPQFKIWLAMNHKPLIQGMDDGIWRRIRLIPFAQSFTGNPDKELIGKLRAELPGILNWALEGLVAWRQQGLGVPKAVEQANDAYRNEMDLVQLWLNEETVDDSATWMSATEGYKRFFEWSQARGQARPRTQTTWGRAMSKRYTDQRQTVAGRKITVYLGLRLRNTMDP